MAEPKRYSQRTNPKQYSYRLNRASNHRKELPSTKQGVSAQNTGNEHHTIPVDNGGSDNKKWAIADKIAMGMLVVTALLAIFTYQLYHTAIHDSKTADTSATAATNAAKIADSTFKASKRYNDSSLKIQEKAYNSNNIAEVKRQKRDSSILSAQIAAFQETKKEFEIENEPLLGVQEIKNFKFLENEAVSFDYVLNNYGKYPIVINRVADKISIIPKSIFENDIKNIDFTDFGAFKLRQCEVIVTKENPYIPSFTNPYKVNKDDINGFYGRKKEIALYGKLIYTSLINNKKREFDFIVGIVVNDEGKVSLAPIKESNYYIKK